MSDKVAIHARRALYMIFDNGLSEAEAQEFIDTTEQPVKGYFYVTDVCDFIRNKTKKAA